MKENNNEIISVIDIGTTKIIVLISEYNLEESKISKIIGFGEHLSDGLRNGVVVDINKTIKSITNAIGEAEQQANFQIDSAFVGISGSHIKGINYSGVASINSKSQPQAIGHSISKDDIKKVLEHAKSINISPDRRIMHVLPQQYIVDDNDGIKDPLGLSGHRLEAKVHLVTSSINTENDILTCLNKIGINVIDFILEPLASSCAVLSKDEMELGSILIDIGGGTTDIIAYGHGSVLQTGVVPIGGEIITKDIAYRIQSSIDQAEKLKRKYGKAKVSLSSDEENISVKGLDGRNDITISEKILSEVIEPRMKEIFELTNIEIEQSDFKGSFTFGIILTGGGSKLDGAINMAHDLFKMPIRLGNPICDFEYEKEIFDVSNPRYSTAIGLAKYAGQNFKNYNELNQNSFINQIKDFFKRIIKQ